MVMVVMLDFDLCLTAPLGLTKPGVVPPFQYICVKCGLKPIVFRKVIQI